MVTNLGSLVTDKLLTSLMQQVVAYNVTDTQSLEFALLRPRHE